jgi:hypothetical protein
MPFYSQHTEIKAFIEAVEQVLNGATVFIEQEFNPSTGVMAYVDEAFQSGKFYDWMQEALGETTRRTEPELLNIQFRLLPFSFLKFKGMLEEMLSLKRSPYSVSLTQNQIRILVDDFIESTVNADQERSHLQRQKEIDRSWRFYCVPRSHDGSMLHEIDDPEVIQSGLYKAEGNPNTDNYLSTYFFNMGGDAFLIFHNDRKIYFLLSNGSD